MRYQIDLRILVIISKTWLSFSFQPNSRGERSYTDTGADEQHRLILQKVLRGRPERTVDHDAGQHAVEGRVRARANDFATWVLLTPVALLVKVAAECLSQLAREITDDADVHGDVIFFRRTIRERFSPFLRKGIGRGNAPGEGEGMPLKVGDLRATDEDILASTCRRLLFLDLDLHHVGRVLDHL